MGDIEIPPSFTTPLLEKIKLPLIISLAAVAGIIVMCLFGVCLMKSNTTLQPATGNTININNESTSKNESPVSIMVTPSCPEVPSLITEAPPATSTGGAPPAYKDSVDIEDLKAIPHSERSPGVARRILEHYESTRRSKMQKY